MSSAAHRLTGSAQFSLAIRTGRRAGSSTLVVHLASPDSGERPRVGFVVSRAVGNAVTRNRVKRRIRHAVSSELAGLPEGSRVVFRALASAATRPDLSADVVDGLHRAVRRSTARRA